VVELDELVRVFAAAVIAQEDAIDAGDSETGNRHAKRYLDAFEELRTYGDRGRDALSELLSDGDARVRVMAAAFLLRHCGQRARSVLEAEARGKGLTAFSASQALMRWDEGSWRLDPADDPTRH
jgi:hypothetical protein